MLRSFRRAVLGGVAAALLGVMAVPAASTPASASTAALCGTTLQLGAQGSCVSALQSRLNELGLRHPLVVDGAFGPATRNAVEAFQGRSDIAVDGVVGPDTRNHLNNPGGVTLASRSTGEIESLIRQSFPDNLEDKAIRVARCESALNEIAVGRNSSSRDFGVFQFNDGGTLQAYLGTTARALDPVANVQAAYRLYQARGWQPWTCGGA